MMPRWQAVCLQLTLVLQSLALLVSPMTVQSPEVALAATVSECGRIPPDRATDPTTVPEFGLSPLHVGPVPALGADGLRSCHIRRFGDKLRLLPRPVAGSGGLVRFALQGGLHLRPYEEARTTVYLVQVLSTLQVELGVAGGSLLVLPQKVGGRQVKMHQMPTAELREDDEELEDGVNYRGADNSTLLLWGAVTLARRFGERAVASSSRLHKGPGGLAPDAWILQQLVSQGLSDDSPSGCGSVSDSSHRKDSPRRQPLELPAILRKARWLLLSPRDAFPALEATACFAAAVEVLTPGGILVVAGLNDMYDRPGLQDLAAIKKPETDSRSYDYLRLPNGLQVIVASDPDKSSAAAAALAVLVGSVHEPKEIPGLAHFCEHMVLHGTVGPLYGADAQFADYIKQHGGSHNAVTTMQQTCFAFEIQADKLEGALCRFARFFVMPSFSRAHHCQEIKAIDSEHSMNTQNDFRRQWAILLMDANPRHQYHWGSGCSKTLVAGVNSQHLDLHQALLKFHGRAYTAGRMCLSVVGTQSTTELLAWARRHFGAVPSAAAGFGGALNVEDPSSLIGDAVGGSEPSFLPEDFRGQVFVVPVKDLRQLRLAWLLPWQVPGWRHKPTSYATYLLGHEGR
ncbi:unnamed protein product, partial [Polarella glacialis]